MERIENFAKQCRKVIPEGIVLLESDGALPLQERENIALFGRGQFEYVKSGTGSGGRVNCDYVTNIGDELDKRVMLDEEVRDFYRTYIAEHPFDIGDGWRALSVQKQPFLDEQFVRSASLRNNKAIFIITRTYGESYDCKPEKGGWYLSDEEEYNLTLLVKHFQHVIVLINSGNLIDMNFVKKYGIGTVACLWQGGQEGGAGTVDVLMGDVPPSGRLTDTIASELSAYPSDNCWGDANVNIHKEDIYVGYRYFETFAKDKVLYPFGYGLNYTQFQQTVIRAEIKDEKILLSVQVKNVGQYTGKEVIQVYYEAPNTGLDAPSRQLVSFKKTQLLNEGESEVCEFEIPFAQLSAYDDSGVSGYTCAYVLEQGVYKIYVGSDVRNARSVLSFEIPETKLIRQCEQALAPVQPFKRLTRNGYQDAPLRTYSVEERILKNLPDELPITGDRGIFLRDVYDKKYTMDEFVAQFDASSLMELVRGEGMSSPKAAVPGTASCFGGTTAVWDDKGVPIVTTCDGPSGIRLECGLRATCIPSGISLASTWNPEALDGVFDGFAEELLGYGIDLVLAPGINIRRHPLCGRNFEYYSEDPYLAGNFACKAVERFAKKGAHCTLKHFAVNSQENNRIAENEVLSERALREIYLKPFEMAVKAGYAKAIMTSYNRVNGRSTAGHYDLTTTILRKEWGYTGLVMSDWWTEIDDKELKNHNIYNLTEMVKAQNDIYMVVPDASSYKDDLKLSYESGYLTLGELQRCAKNILNFTMDTLAFRENRKSDVGKLFSTQDMVFSAELEDKPLIVCSAEQSWIYRGHPVKRLQVLVPQENMYCGEIRYCLLEDSLVQRTFDLCVDGHEPIRLVCNGTEGRVGKQRFKIYLRTDSEIIFNTESIIGLALYKL